MSKNTKKNLRMLIALHCSSKAQKKELLKHLKPDTIKAILHQNTMHLTTETSK